MWFGSYGAAIPDNLFLILVIGVAYGRNIFYKHAKGSQIPVWREKWPIYEKVIKIFFLCAWQNCSFVITLHMVLSFQKFSGVFRLHLKTNYWLVQILQYCTVWLDKDDRGTMESKWVLIFNSNRESIYTVKESKNWLMQLGYKTPKIIEC